jgi:hypothetical protein
MALWASGALKPHDKVETPSVGDETITLSNYLTNASTREDRDKCSKGRIQDYRNKRR